MPDKTPDVWAVIWTWLALIWSRNGSQLSGFIAAAVVSYFRALLYGKNDAICKRLAEAVVCGIIATTSQPILLKMGLDDEYLPFLGTMLGLLGLDFVMNKIRYFVDRFVSKMAKKTGEK